MAQVVRYHRRFRSDVAEYAAWFEEQAPGLGDSFAEAIESALQSLKDRPLSHRVSWKHYRRVLVRRFRVVVLFEVHDDGVYVLGVVHGSRDLPSWISGRVKDDE